MGLQDVRIRGIQSGIEKMNAWGALRVPFLFVIDYAMQDALLYPLEHITGHRLLFNINGFTNHVHFKQRRDLVFHKYPIPFPEYQQAFEIVMSELKYGNSFLLNLTCATPVSMNWTLREVFEASHAKYKLCLNDSFVVFSPESFVRIRKGRISSFPMKGTIDASLHDARTRILDNPKEKAEHVTIVDLIRNDLSMVAKDVRVDRFRYVEELHTNQKTLLQVSSEISGKLSGDYYKRLGDIVYTLLPAGSISGAPKKKTVEILKDAETHTRGFFTGIFGYFDGMDLDSGVMIRYIERQGDQLMFKSGGGITTQSKADEEYQEMIDKVYIPAAGF